MKKTNFSLFTFSLLFFSCTYESTWNDVFHADEAHTGVYETSGYKNLGALKWKFKTGGKIFSSPVVMHGTVFLGSEDSNLYAIKTKSGELDWKFPTGGAVSSSPAIFNNTVYFTSYDGNCYAVDAGSGKQVWKFKTGGEKKIGAIGLWTMKPADMYMEDLWDFFLSSPVIGINKEGINKGPTVYFGSSDGNLYEVASFTPVRPSTTEPFSLAAGIRIYMPWMRKRESNYGNSKQRSSPFIMCLKAFRHPPPFSTASYILVRGTVFFMH